MLCMVSAAASAALLPASDGPLWTGPKGATDWAQQFRRLSELHEASFGRTGQQVHEDMIYCLVMMGKIKEARGEALALLQQYPTSPQALATVVWTLRCDGQERMAMDSIRAGLQRFPRDLVVVNSAAWMMATSQNPKYYDPTRALQLAEAVSKVDGGKNVAYLDTLAAAQAAAGQFSQAVATQQRAIARLQQDDFVAKVYGSLRLEFAHRLAIYQRGERYHWLPPRAES